MSGRFTAPVTPGQTLVVSVWLDGDGSARFRTARPDGAVVLDRGRLRYRDPAVAAQAP
jgi:acyl dehydratase